jgi:hypothetical protein
MPEPHDVSNAILRLVQSARRDDKKTLRAEKSAFLKEFGSCGPFIGPAVEMLIKQPRLDEPPQFLAQLLDVDPKAIFANTGPGAIAGGSSSFCVEKART